MTETPIESPYLSRAEAAKFYGISERKLDLLVAHDGLPRILVGRLVKFDVADLREWMDSNKRSTRQTEQAPALAAA